MCVFIFKTSPPPQKNKSFKLFFESKLYLLILKKHLNTKVFKIKDYFKKIKPIDFHSIVQLFYL